ncbi:hypothetical protein Tco_0760627 [Tanacetum coccineum]
MSMTIQSSVKDKILATSSETSKVENAPAEMLRDLDQQMEKRADDGCTLWIKLYSKYEYEIRYHPGKANVVIEALSRKERVKPRRVRAMAMTIQYGVRGMILTAQSEAFKQENVLAEILHGLDQQEEIGESGLTGPELVLDMTDKVVLIKEKLKAVRDRQKSYADNRRKPLEFEIKVDKTLRFVEEPVEIMDREIKRLKHRKATLVKVRWNSKRGPEFTWEHEEHMRIKAACEALGLLGDENEWDIAMQEAYVSTMSPQIRFVFAHLLTHCEVTDPVKL